MRVLFVSSGNKGTISPIIKNQGVSISKYNPEIKIDFFLIKGRGIKGYLSNIPQIRHSVLQNNPDIIHAHYSFCGILVVLALLNKPIVTSLMGSDIKAKKYYRFIIRFFSKYFWKATIVKSEDMKISSKIGNSLIIPNGVDFEKFYPISKESARLKLNWDKNNTIILFAANPKRIEKNYQLAKEAIDLLGKDLEIKFTDNVKNDEMIYYYNAADIVILTSLWEGSPNVIKEAMACNMPIVSTDVGDIKWIFGTTKGCYLTSFNANILSDLICKAIEFSRIYGKTKGRDRLIELGLHAKVVSSKLENIYNRIFKIETIYDR